MKETHNNRSGDVGRSRYNWTLEKCIIFEMRVNSETMQSCSLCFRNADLERRFQATRMRYDDLPYCGRLLLWVILFICSLRRLYLFFGAYFSFKGYDPSGELRLTSVYFSGLLLELVVYQQPIMLRLRGAISTFTTFWIIIDGSCFYHPVEPGLMPM